MTEFLTEHWLSAGVGIFLLAMVLYGHYRGFLRLAVTMTALILSLVVVRVAMPYVTAALKENTNIQETIGHGLLQLAEGGKDKAEDPGRLDEDGGSPEDGGTDFSLQLPAQQRAAIEQLKLPQQMKDALLANNNNEIYRMLGVDAFMDYLGAYLANMVLNLVGSVLLFLVAFVVIRLVIKWLDLIAMLPILSGLNKISGALLGGLQGLLLVWVAGLVVKACISSAWAQTVLAQVNESLWLSFLYHNNLIDRLLTGILNSLV